VCAHTQAQQQAWCAQAEAGRRGQQRGRRGHPCCAADVNGVQAAKGPARGLRRRAPCGCRQQQQPPHTVVLKKRCSFTAERCALDESCAVSHGETLTASRQVATHRCPQASVGHGTHACAAAHMNAILSASRITSECPKAAKTCVVQPNNNSNQGVQKQATHTSTQTGPCKHACVGVSTHAWPVCRASTLHSVRIQCR
jgi:hypothetical protein